MNMEETIYQMLIENTGSHLCDSGGIYGRHWEKNQTKSLSDFRSAPPALFTITEHSMEHSVSIFHLLTNGNLSEDRLCREFNEMECKAYDGDYFGTSADQCEWLAAQGINVNDNCFNTYNYQCNLTQILQGHFAVSDHDINYILLQIHNGCDARAGYTDAKLFRIDGYIDFPQDVISDHALFSLPNKRGETISVETFDDYVYINGEYKEGSHDVLWDFLEGEEAVAVGEIRPIS